MSDKKWPDIRKQGPEKSGENRHLADRRRGQCGADLAPIRPMTDAEFDKIVAGFEQVAKDLGARLHGDDDPLYRAILITETMREAGYQDRVFDPDQLAAIIDAVYNRVLGGDSDLDASATACILMRPSTTREDIQPRK